MCVCVCKQMHRSPQLGTRLQHGMVLQHWMASKSFWPEWRRIRDESIWLCRQKRWPWKNWSTGVCSHVPTHSRALAFTHSHRPLAHTPNSLSVSHKDPTGGRHKYRHRHRLGHRHRHRHRHRRMQKRAHTQKHVRAKRQRQSRRMQRRTHPHKHVRANVQERLVLAEW
jgi:hypothetical protein